jgi:DNA-binding transcriptional LysR family regulator
MIPTGHPLSKKRSASVKIEDLAPYELIIPSRHSRKKEIEGWFALVQKEPKIICRIAHMLNAYELTAHGLGITIYPAAAAEYASEDVCIKPLSHPAVSATYILIRSNSRTHSLVAREFWDAVPADR